MKRWNWLVVLLAILWAGPALAEEEGAAPQGDLYLKLYLGVAMNQDSDLRISQPTLGNDLSFRGVGWDDRSLDFGSAPYYGIRVGHFLDDTPWLGVSFDFLHFKALAQTERTVRVDGVRRGAAFNAAIPMDSIVEHYNMSHGVNFATFNVLGRLQLEQDSEFPQGRIQPYAGFGLGPTILHTHATVDGVENEDRYELANLGVQAFTGLQLMITPEVDLFAEYKFTYTEATGSIANGIGTTPLSTHHIAFGTGYHF